MKIGYARVSTINQSYDMQIEALKKYGIDERFIFRETISTRATTRPELKKAFDFMNKGDSLVVFKLDRIGRSMEDLISKIKFIKDKGVEFISLTDSFDTSTASGMLQFHMICAFAQFERDIDSERTCEGLDNARSRGIILGNKQLNSQPQIDLLEDLLSRGLSKYEIMRKMGLKSRTPIYYYLRNKK